MKKIIRSKLFIFYSTYFPSLTCSLAEKFLNLVLITIIMIDLKNNFKDTLDYSKNKWEVGYDIVCIGHYHQTGIIKHKNKEIIYLGDWLSKFTVTCIKNGKSWQGDWKEFLINFDLAIIYE